MHKLLTVGTYFILTPQSLLNTTCNLLCSFQHPLLGITPNVISCLYLIYCATLTLYQTTNMNSIKSFNILSRPFTPFIFPCCHPCRNSFHPCNTCCSLRAHSHILPTYVPHSSPQIALIIDLALAFILVYASKIS